MTISLAQSLASLPEVDRTAILASLTEEQAEELRWSWQFWARPEQVPPPGEWLTWLILAGRGAGKTRTGAEWVRANVCGATPLAAGKFDRIALVAETAADARDVMVEGQSGIIAVHPPAFRPIYEPSKRRLTWPNGAQGSLYNATEPDQLRGPQFSAAWCFIAGTAVATARGDRAIESLEPGDLVWTRAGLRRVTHNSSRIADVGRVRFDGSELVGTAEHPVLTSSGWVSLSRLQLGMEACAVSALSLAANAGIATGKEDISSIEGLGALLGSTANDYIARFGERCAAIFHLAMTSIIAMVTLPTTTFQIWLAFPTANTCGAIALRSRYRGQIGRGGPSSNNAATIAAPSSSEKWLGQRFAIGVSKNALIGNERHLERVCTAGLNLPASAVGFAASVVSTWEPVGRAEVFNLQVDGQPEYFANGILVHNCDELAKWRYAQETWDMLQFGLRLGVHPQQVVTTTPRPIGLIKTLMRDASTVVTRGSTYDNAANLAASFVEQIVKRYEGTRLGRQELHAEIMDDVPGSLWARRSIDEYRLKAESELPDLQRVVVGVDPAVASASSDATGRAETGIVVAGLGVDGIGYVLADLSCRMGPDGWARRAISGLDRYDGDAIVAETNQGGAMVAGTIRAVRPNVKVIEVTATRGKVVRAEPVAALYEQGRVKHVGALAELEDQMVLFTGAGIEGGSTGDRVDALVWALTELFPRMTRKTERASGGNVKVEGVREYRPHGF